MQCEFFARSASAPVRLTFSANGTALTSEPGDKVDATSEWGRMSTIRKRFTPEGTSLSLGISMSISSPVSLANLDRLALTYTRSLTLPASGTLTFTSSERSLRLGGAKAETRVWDVTKPNEPIAMPVSNAADGTPAGPMTITACAPTRPGPRHRPSPSPARRDSGQSGHPRRGGPRHDYNIPLAAARTEPPHR